MEIEEELATKYTSEELLNAFIIKEVEFRVKEQMIDTTGLNDEQRKELVSNLIDELIENTDVVFDYDAIDSFLQDKADKYTFD
jgi:hypothetical protein